MVSELLAYLSLAGFLALLGQSAWKTWVMSDQTWGLHDHGLDKAREVVEWALRHCLDRGMMVVSARGTEHQVLLRKYIRLFGDRGLVFGFPDAQWSRQYIPRLCSELDARNIRFRKANEPYGQVNVVLHVDCGQDLDGAADLVRYCFLDLFQLDPGIRLESVPTEYSRIGEDVHDPDYQDPTGSEWWPAFRRRMMDQGYPDPKLSFQASAIIIGWICCFPALWIFWFLALGATPDWSLAIGSIKFAGSSATLVTLPVYGILLVGWWQAGKKIARFGRLRARTLVDRLAYPLVFYAMPLAVVASWMGI